MSRVSENDRSIERKETAGLPGAQRRVSATDLLRDAEKGGGPLAQPGPFYIYCMRIVLSPYYGIVNCSGTCLVVFIRS